MSVIEACYITYCHTLMTIVWLYAQLRALRFHSLRIAIIDYCVWSSITGSCSLRLGFTSSKKCRSQFFFPNTPSQKYYNYSLVSFLYLILQTCSLIPRAPHCCISCNVEHTKRAKSDFLTLEVDISKTKHDTRNVSTFS